MKNIFQIVYDQGKGTADAEYEKYIIRKLSKKEQESIERMSHKFSSAHQKSVLPRWVFFLLRTSFSASFISVLIWILMLIGSVKNGLSTFLKDYLWLEIVCLVSVLLLLISLLIAFILKKIIHNSDLEKKADDIFENIMRESKRCLNVPETALNLEVLMDQVAMKKNGELRESKFRSYSNVILSVYKDDTTLYLSDLYVVIAIPLKDVKMLGEKNEGYRFKYWHKAKSYKEYGVKAIKSAGCYQADSYYNLLCLEDTDYGIYIPPYEIDEWKKILNE